MDCNGASFLMLAGAADLRPADDPDRVAWDPVWRVLRLSSQRPEPSLSEDAAQAGLLREAVPEATDSSGARTRVEQLAVGEAVMVSQSGWPDREIFRRVPADFPNPITDVCIGHDGVISVAVSGGLVLRDSRTFGDEREDWRRIDLSALAGRALAPWRVAPRAGDGAWILDRDNGLLAQWTGSILRNRPAPDFAGTTFRPDPEDPQTLFARVLHADFGGDTLAGLACSADGRVAVLGLPADGEARVHLFSAEGAFERRLTLAGLRHPTSLAWIGEDRLAFIATNTTEPGRIINDALVYPVEVDDTRAMPAGERYPLRRHDGRGFVHTLDGKARYPTAEGPRVLQALSLPLRASNGNVVCRSLDGGAGGTCWHRLYVEASVPEGCGVRIWVAASDSPTPPTDEAAWFPHDVGDTPPLRFALEPAAGWVDPKAQQQGVEYADWAKVPKAAWVPAYSEIPQQKMLLPLTPRMGLTGLFTVLIQRQGYRSTRLYGRHLHMRLTLYGTGRSSPQLAAIRAWNPRFSYVRSYLPELYHEDPLVDGSAEVGPTTPADYLERFLGLFEGIITPLEDKVAEAWLLTNPQTAPAEALDWLAAWVGRLLDPNLDEAARRRLLSAFPELSRWRGTKHGLELAIEAITNGGITRGDVIVLEEFRLRRTFATILGADLADETDPLVGGLSVSGNSILGDTLFLGDEHQREFLALFGEGVTDPKLAHTAKGRALLKRDREAVAKFFEKTANRVTVLVFQGTETRDIGLIRRMVEAEAPVHVSTRVMSASRSFIAGISALVGIDTRLTPKPEPRTVRLGRTWIGKGDRVRRPPGLHPDLEGEGG